MKHLKMADKYITQNGEVLPPTLKTDLTFKKIADKYIAPDGSEPKLVEDWPEKYPFGRKPQLNLRKLQRMLLTDQEIAD